MRRHVRTYADTFFDPGILGGYDGWMAKRASKSAEKKGGTDRAVVTTTFRIYKDQLDALQRAALEKRARGETTRNDASALLRQLLDDAGMKA